MNTKNHLEHQIDFKKLISRALYVGRKSIYPELADDFAQWVCLKVLEEGLEEVGALDFLFLNYKTRTFGKVGRPSFNLSRGVVPMDNLIGESELTLHDVLPGSFPTPEEALEMAEWMEANGKDVQLAVKIEKRKQRKLRASPLGLEIFNHLLEKCDPHGVVEFYSTEYGLKKGISNKTINLSLAGLINKGLVRKERRGRYRIVSRDVRVLLSQDQLEKLTD